MLPPASASAIGFRSLPQLEEVFHLPAHPSSTALVRPEQLKLLPTTVRRSWFRASHFRRRRSKRYFENLTVSCCADSSGSIPQEGQCARVLAGGRLTRSGRLSTTSISFPL